MKEVFIVSDNILSPLGTTTADNFEQLTRSVSGIRGHSVQKIASSPFYASLFDVDTTFINDANFNYTKFEQLLIKSIQAALQDCDINTADKKNILIISSAKGNISLLETEEYDQELKKRIALHSSAKLIGQYFGFANQPLVVSNACISGVLAIITAMRMLQSGQYENAIVAGADVISKFVLLGFQSFKAISAEPCKPFDKDRDGITLGEGAGTVILSSDKKYADGIKVAGGATGNDANHISGPSRTGAELAGVIKKAMLEDHLQPLDIDFISAHGTATLYNDEMEARAFSLAGMAQVPINSLKGYYGHTLGAAGLIESIVTLQSMRTGMILPTKGFERPGVSQAINICNTLLPVPLHNCLKTASGFGGCNAAVVFSKSEN
jgi:3-oxoacyl-[acyl-carrier-protein] synthase-1